MESLKMQEKRIAAQRPTPLPYVEGEQDGPVPLGQVESQISRQHEAIDRFEFQVQHLADRIGNILTANVPYPIEQAQEKDVQCPLAEQLQLNNTRIEDFSSFLARLIQRIEL